MAVGDPTEQSSVPDTEALLREAELAPAQTKSVESFNGFKREQEEKLKALLSQEEIPVAREPVQAQQEVERDLNPKLEQIAHETAEAAVEDLSTAHAFMRSGDFDKFGNSTQPPLKPHEALDRWGAEKAELRQQLKFYRYFHPLVIAAIWGVGGAAAVASFVTAAAFWPAALVIGGTAGIIALMRRQKLQEAFESKREE